MLLAPQQSCAGATRFVPFDAYIPLPKVSWGVTEILKNEQNYKITVMNTK
jgi:hypothetical protein